MSYVKADEAISAIARRNIAHIQGSIERAHVDRLISDLEGMRDRLTVEEKLRLLNILQMADFV